MPDTQTLTLILMVGIAAGALVTLIMDSAFLNKRIQEEKMQTVRLEGKVQLARTQVKHLRKGLEDAGGWREQANHLLEVNEELEQKLAAAESEIGQLTAQVQSTLLRLTETQNLRKQIVATEMELRNVQAQLKEAQNQVVFLRLEGKEDLTIIRGIGTAYAHRLQAEGIKTLADLAKADPDRVAQVVQLKKWQNADPKKWIMEAKELAAVFADDEEE